MPPTKTGKPFSERAPLRKASVPDAKIAEAREAVRQEYLRLLEKSLAEFEEESTGACYCRWPTAISFSACACRSFRWTGRRWKRCKAIQARARSQKGMRLGDPMTQIAEEAVEEAIEKSFPGQSPPR